MSNVGKATDGLLDALGREKRRADTYEQMLDKAHAAVVDAQLARPGDFHLDRIERALTE